MVGNRVVESIDAYVDKHCRSESLLEQVGGHDGALKIIRLLHPWVDLFSNFYPNAALTLNRYADYIALNHLTYETSATSLVNSLPDGEENIIGDSRGRYLWAIDKVRRDYRHSRAAGNH